MTHRVQDPRGAVPGWGIEDGPEVEEEHGHDTTAIHVRLGVIRWVCNLDVRADDPHANRATQGTDQE